MGKLKLFWLLSYFASLSLADAYDRKDFNHRSYKPGTDIGFYTGKTCDFTNIDHVVSLKDAYESGASSWGASKRKAFANNRPNTALKGLRFLSRPEQPERFL